MTMSPVNLIPAARLAATRRRASVRWWSGGCGAYAAVLVAILLGLRLLGGANPASVQARIVETQATIEQYVLRRSGSRLTATRSARWSIDRRL